MFCMKYYVYILFVQSFTTCTQINLSLTDAFCRDDDSNSNRLQHNCLHVPSIFRDFAQPEQIIHYCLGECPTEWINHVIYDQPHWSFSQLVQQNMTSQQLYLWSAPIDIAERYQHYLNQLTSSGTIDMIEDGVFYNCTWPRFGPFCQYSFDYISSLGLSLSELVHDFYANHPYESTTFTCYRHVKCNRGPVPICLDWSEICDGRVDCLESGEDEKYCWQLEINECEENEYRCANGQCISKIFIHDSLHFADCLDQSDESLVVYELLHHCSKHEAIFGCEAVRCETLPMILPSPLTSSCMKQRRDLLMQILYSTRSEDLFR